MSRTTTQHTVPCRSLLCCGVLWCGVVWCAQAALEAESRHQLESVLQRTAAAAAALKDAKVGMTSSRATSHCIHL
jgi:hypothetical protein